MREREKVRESERERERERERGWERPAAEAAFAEGEGSSERA
jgi:hypothetical protein